MPVVRYLSTRIAVMYRGKIVEIGTTDEDHRTPAERLHEEPAGGHARNRGLVIRDAGRSAWRLSTAASCSNLYELQNRVVSNTEVLMSVRNGSRLLAIAVLIVPLTSAQIIPTETANRINVIVAKAISDQQIPAISIAVAVNGQIQYQRAFGKADLENNVPATSETLFRTASIAKPMTAVAVMGLVDDGKFDLDAPIQKYCPAFPRKQWTITTRELLGHLSGIRHYNEREMDNTRHYEKLSDGFAIFANDPLLFDPGTKFEYSTYGFSVIGCEMEGVTGKPYPEIMQQEVFARAHMTHTFVDDVFEIIPYRARGYSKRDGKVINAGLMDSSYKIPGGGYVSTPGDLVTLADDLLAGTMMKPALPQTDVDLAEAAGRQGDGIWNGLGHQKVRV